MAKKEHMVPMAPEEFQNEDFKFLLQTLLDSYKPILEQEFKQAASADKLRKEGRKDSLGM